MNTPPFSDVANSPTHNALAAVDSEDVRQLYTSSWRTLDTQPPPTIREILAAYRAKGDGDRDMLLAMLQAKSAEDQRLASQAALRRTMLEITQAAEPEPLPSTPPAHISPHSYVHGQPISTQGISPRIAHSTASHAASPSAAHHGYAAPRDGFHHRTERSPELDVDGRSIGARTHHRQSSFPNAQHVLEGQPLSRYSSHSQNAQTSRGYATHYQEQDTDRRKRLRRSPSPPPPVATISQSSRVRSTAAVSSKPTPSASAGTLKLHDSPPQTRAHNALVGGSTVPVPSTSIAHAKSRAHPDNGISNGCPAPASATSTYASRRAKREFDELEDGGGASAVGMETGPRGLVSGTGRDSAIARATYSAMRRRSGRSLSPLEDEDAVVLASVQGRTKEGGGGGGELRDGEHASVGSAFVAAAPNANANANPSAGNSESPRSAHSSPPGRSRKAQTQSANTADRERWDAVLSGHRERSQSEGDVHAKEVDPAR